MSEVDLLLAAIRGCCRRRLTSTPTRKLGRRTSTAIDYSDTRASVDVLMSIAAYFRLEASDAPEVLAEVTRAVT
jgi:hypothetical protein